MMKFFPVMVRLPLILGALAVCAVLVSCSAQITGTIAADASGGLTVKAGLEPKTAALIRGLAALQTAGGGASRSRPLLDAAALNKSLAAAPGVASSALRNTSPEAVEGTVAVSHIADLLAAKTPAGGRAGFIRFQMLTGGRGGVLGINLDRASAPALIALISTDMVDYLSALMAPAATGEALSRVEYLDLVAAVYGKGIADEIAAARILVQITMPGQVQSVRGGSFRGRTVNFDVPLADFLVLETPIDYEVVWR